MLICMLMCVLIWGSGLLCLGQDEIDVKNRPFGADALFTGREVDSDFLIPR
jgi:hypothetical protein